MPGLKGLGEFIWKIKVPLNAIWRLLPWNKGRDATCQLTIPYLDPHFRIAQDADVEFFVYTRPVVLRAFDLAP